jgi:drug/metabolite transporter (DMT)-like permease
MVLSTHLRAILFALGGFSLWVLADTCVKLAGEANLPAFEIVGFLGLFASSTLVAIFAPQGRVKELWPKKPMPQVWRSILAFGCVMCNAVALKHLPLTMFYMVIFTGPMVIAILAALLLHEEMSWQTIVAIVSGFVGVVIAINPWDTLNGGDWIGYLAGAGSVLCYGVATIYLRCTRDNDTVFSMMFMTGLVEAVLGFTCMLWHAEPVVPLVLLILAAMGFINVIGNLCNGFALQLISAATVEQFHYTQIIIGAALAYFIWHEIPTLAMVVGTIIIVASGLFIIAHMQGAEKIEAQKRAASASLV